jgi:hypothetical protein
VIDSGPVSASMIALSVTGRSRSPVRVLSGR